MNQITDPSAEDAVPLATEHQNMSHRASSTHEGIAVAAPATFGCAAGACRA